MRKIVTLIAGGLLFSATTIAQTITLQDFESVTVPALPAGWTQQTKATTGWKTNTGSIVANGSWTLKAHTKYAVIDDWNNNEDNDSSMLISPSFSLAGKTGAYLYLDYYYVQAQYSSTGQKEEAYVRVSVDGGANWVDVDTFKGKPSEWQSKYISLAAFDNKPNVMVAFIYMDNGTAQLPGIAVDNIKVFVPQSNDVTVVSVDMPALSATDMAAGNGTTVKVNVINNGSNAITSLEMSYSIDGGTPVVETISSLNIASFASDKVTFTTALSGITPGSHTIAINATKVNNATDANPSDNQTSGSFVGVSNSVPRAGLIEEFTSSTCAPCASFNTVFDPLVLSNNANVPASNFNVIKYQMNWPSPGNDASYNPHGVSRRTYYGVNSIPDHFTNGLPGGNGDQAEIDASKSGNSFIDITGSYTITNDSGYVHVSVKPFFTYTHNLKVHIAVVEKDYYNYKATTTQKHYVHVMRMMLPNGDGNTVSNWIDNTAQDFDFAKKFTSGTTVTQNSYILWTHPKNTNIVVFVQDDDTKQVLQSKVIEAQWATNVADLNNNISELALYPNPATTNTTAGFTSKENTTLRISVTDAIGRVVYNTSYNATKGFNEISIPTANFSNGIYSVKIQSEGGSVTQHLSVVK